MKTVLHPLAELTRAFAMVIAAIAATLCLAAQAGRFSDRLDVLTHFAPVWMGFCLFATTLWIISGSIGRITPVLALMGVLSGLPLMTPSLMAAAQAQTAAPGLPTLKLVQFNLWAYNKAPLDSARWILETDPDIVILEEANGQSRAILKALKVRYPFKTTCADPRPCSTVILSKSKPIAKGGLAEGNDPAALMAAWATFEHDGAPFTVIGNHYVWPFPAGPQQQQALRLAGVLNRFDRQRLIVAGDFNSTPWSFSMRRQDRIFGLDRQTHGLPTWPAAKYSRLRFALPFPILPIDQIYTGAGWRTVTLRRGPRLGSDHFPLVITLVTAP